MSLIYSGQSKLSTTEISSINTDIVVIEQDAKTKVTTTQLNTNSTLFEKFLTDFFSTYKITRNDGYIMKPSDYVSFYNELDNTFDITSDYATSYSGAMTQQFNESLLTLQSNLTALINSSAVRGVHLNSGNISASDTYLHTWSPITFGLPNPEDYKYPCSFFKFVDRNDIMLRGNSDIGNMYFYNVFNNSLNVPKLLLGVGSGVVDVGTDISDLKTIVSTLLSNPVSQSVDLTSINNQILSIQSKQTADEANITANINNLNTTNSNVSNLQTAVNILQSNPVSQNVDLTPVNTRIDDIQIQQIIDESNINNLTGNINTLQGKMTTANTNIATLTSLTSTLTSTVGGFSGNYAVVTSNCLVSSLVNNPSITKVLIKLIGGGGGGANGGMNQGFYNQNVGGGGGSGGYCEIVLSGLALSYYNISVGKGGAVGADGEMTTLGIYDSPPKFNPSSGSMSLIQAEGGKAGLMSSGSAYGAGGLGGTFRSNIQNMIPSITHTLIAGSDGNQGNNTGTVYICSTGNPSTGAVWAHGSPGTGASGYLGSYGAGGRGTELYIEGTAGKDGYAIIMW